MSLDNVEALRTFFAGLSRRELLLELCDPDVIDVSDDCVVISHRLTGRGRTSSIPMDWFWWSTIRFRNGKLARVIGSMTRRQALEAVGVTEL